MRFCFLQQKLGYLISDHRSWREIRNIKVMKSPPNGIHQRGKNSPTSTQSCKINQPLVEHFVTLLKTEQASNNEQLWTSE